MWTIQAELGLAKASSSAFIYYRICRHERGSNGRNPDPKDQLLRKFLNSQRPVSAQMSSIKTGTWENLHLGQEFGVEPVSTILVVAGAC